MAWSVCPLGSTKSECRYQGRWGKQTGEQWCSGAGPAQRAAHRRLEVGHQGPGCWRSHSLSGLWPRHCLSLFFSRAQILMIRYPSSQLGEMSLEEHSQCECRCQPGPASKLAESRRGGCRAWQCPQWGPSVFKNGAKGRPGIWGQRAGCLAFLIFLLSLSLSSFLLFRPKNRESAIKPDR